MIWHVRTATIVLLLSACQPGSSGRLLVEPGDGIAIGKKSVAGDVAITTAGKLRISTYGFWASNGGQELYVSYANSGGVPVTINVGDFEMRSGVARADLVQVQDITGMKTDEVDLSPDDPRLLIDINAGRRGAELVVPAGATRTVSAGFARFLPVSSQPAVGVRIDVQLPIGGSARKIRFRGGGGDL